MPMFATTVRATHGTETVDLSPVNDPGFPATDTDGNAWLYLKGVTGCGRGSVVTYDHLAQTTLLAANAKGPVAVAGAPVPAGQWGWFCVSALVPVPTLVAPSTLPNAFVGVEGQPGMVGDGRLAGDQIRGMMTRPVPFPAGSYAARVVADGASNYWRLGERTGLTAVDVVGGAHGTISGGVTLGQAGAVLDDTAMAFAGGTGRVRVPGGWGNFGTGAWTVELWLRYTSTAANMYPLESTYEAGRRSGINFYMPSGGAYFRFELITSTITTAAPLLAAVTGKNTHDNRWHAFVGVLDRGPDTFIIYLDGIEVRRDALADAGALNTANALNFGLRYNYSSDEPYTGQIDDVAIYRRALTPAQVLAHYQLATVPVMPLPTYADLIRQDGAAHHWRLNDTGTTALDSIGTAHGTLSGGVTTGQPGPFDACMTFDGTTGKVVTAVTGVIRIPFTVEAWINVPVGDGSFRPILSNRAIEGGPGLIWFGMSSNVLTVYDGAATNVNAPLFYLPNGLWHLVQATFDGVTVRLYADGMLQAQGSFVWSAAAPQPITLGHDVWGATFWSGRIDDLALYPRALRADQIRAHYEAGLLTRCQFSYPFVDDAYGA